jgi:hypothetical protein
LKDVFGIQGEIAQKVAEQLRAKISSAERLAIHRPPTADLTAFNLYSRAKIFSLLKQIYDWRKAELFASH